MIEAILSRSAPVKVLATSREGLRLADEQLWPVPSLDVRSGIDSSSATLFVERAHAVAPTFSMTDDTEAVDEICRRLDGIPLAIELAASRMQSMTATEVRERLDDRFRLLVGSRREMERHQTLRHAVQWSYDLLDDAEKRLLASCSVFAGGFDIAGACAVADSADELTTLDLLDALVRKSLLVADRSAARTRYSTLETIRQFSEEQLVHAGRVNEIRAAHAHYFASREEDLLALWDSPRQRQAYEWFNLELPNLRAAFRWAADRNDLDTATAIAFYAAFLGFWVEQFEPIAWAEELIESARAADHRRLAQLLAIATQCYAAGRLDDALGYAEAGQLAINSGRFEAVPYDFESWMGGPYLWTGVPEKWLGVCRNVIARGRDAGYFARANLAMALAFNGTAEEALAASENLVVSAEATENPVAIAYALVTYAYTRRGRDAAAAYESCRRGFAIVQESGNRQLESHLAGNLSMLAADHGGPVDALDYLALAIRNHFNSGSFSLMLTPLAILATELCRLGHHEPAAMLSGFANTPFTRASYLEMKTLTAHLREALGDDTYEANARVGKAMTPAAVATYAFEQIDLARADLLHDGDSL
jgi:predicted ATPase